MVNGMGHTNIKLVPKSKLVLLCWVPILVIYTSANCGNHTKTATDNKQNPTFKQSLLELWCWF
jgi:hypothetical protein